MTIYSTVKPSSCHDLRSTVVPINHGKCHTPKSKSDTEAAASSKFGKMLNDIQRALRNSREAYHHLTSTAVPTNHRNYQKKKEAKPSPPPTLQFGKVRSTGNAQRKPHLPPSTRFVHLGGYILRDIDKTSPDFFSGALSFPRRTPGSSRRRAVM